MTLLNPSKMNANEHFEKACSASSRQWAKTCYTPLLMLDFLLKLGHFMWPEYVHNLNLKPQKKEIVKGILEAADDSLIKLWKDGAGLCTSWAILISNDVHGCPDVDCFGDQGHHRAGYAENGVVIDSTARNPLLLHKGEKETVAKTTWWMDNVGTAKATLYSVKSLLLIHLLRSNIGNRKRGGTRPFALTSSQDGRRPSENAFYNCWKRTTPHIFPCSGIFNSNN